MVLSHQDVDMLDLSDEGDDSEVSKSIEEDEEKAVLVGKTIT